MKTKKTKKQTKTGISKEINKGKPRDGLRLSSPPSVIEFFAQVHLTNHELDRLYTFILHSVDVHLPDGEDGKLAIFFFDDPTTECTNFRDVLAFLADHGFNIRAEQYVHTPNKPTKPKHPSKS